MLERGFNVTRTSSAGRLFDAVASLAGLRHIARHEGQAAMDLEFALGPEAESEGAYPLPLLKVDAPGGGGRWILDWEPLARGVLEDAENGVAPGPIAARFHNALVEGIVETARMAGRKRVALSGGCFQNRYLLERSIERLIDEGYRVYWPQRVPPNDGGIALGQIAAALRGPREENA